MKRPPRFLVTTVRLGPGSSHSVSSPNFNISLVLLLFREVFFVRSCQSYYPVDPESPRVGLCEAGEVCVREMARYLAAVGLSERKLTGVRWFLPRFSSSPPLSSDGVYDDLSVISPP